MFTKKGQLVSCALFVIALMAVLSISSLADPLFPPSNRSSIYKITLQNVDRGQFVCAEGGGGGAVNARSGGIGNWETFYLVDGNGGQLNYRDPIYIRTIRGNVFCAEGGGWGDVNTTRTDPREWETFTLRYAANGPAQRVFNGDLVSIWSWNNQTCVCSDYGAGGNGPLRANRTGVGSWETYRIGITPVNMSEAAAEFALTKLGHPYVWGAKGTDQFDCSGLTKWAYGKAEKPLPDGASQQADNRYVNFIRKDQLQRGDLIFSRYTNDTRPVGQVTHVSLYLGDGWFVNANIGPQNGVQIDRGWAYDNYYFHSAGRIRE